MKKVHCTNCNKLQDDRGKDQTCIKCGFFPLLSYSYHKTSIFHPDSKPRPISGSHAGLPTALRGWHKAT